MREFSDTEEQIECSAQAILDDEEVKVPLSISLPPLLPSTRRMGATYGNFIRVSYHVKLKTTIGSHNCAWEIPIHVGTTSHPYNCASAVDMDYVILKKDDANENNTIYGVIFTKLSTPWPTEKDEYDSEKLTLEMSKVNSVQVTEQSGFSLGGGTHTSIIAPCDYSESQMQIDASTLTNNSLNKPIAPSYILTNAQ